MSLKVKLVSFISMFILVLSLMLISVFAATNVTLNIGGNVSFTASSVNALITGSIAGNAAGGSTLTTIDIDASDPDGPVSMPSDWTSMDLTFTESASPIIVTINIQNRSTDREIAVSLTDSTNISNVEVIRECDGVGINASDSRNIPGGETITYTFELNVQSQNSSANGAFDLTIGLETYVPQTYDYFTFDIKEDNQTVTLTAYNSSLSDSTDVVIPATVSQNSSGEWIEGDTYTVTAINNNATSSSNSIFRNSGITSINLPSTLLSIGNYAFYGCDGLTGELNLGGCTSLTSIGSYAFRNCSGLTGELDFSNCTSLTSIGSGAFRDCNGLTSISLPSSLKAIASSAFSTCSGLTGELNLGKCTSLTSIGNDAFYYCSGLTSISLPSSLTSIGERAFCGCRGLTSISLPSSLTSIGSWAFSNCSGLTGTVTIPTSVTSIGDNPFASCSNLEGIVVEEGNSEYYIEGNCLIENSTKTLITGFNNSTIPSDIKIIGGSAFRDCSGLTSISLPLSLTSIGWYAFYGCSGLTSVDLSGCTSLTSIGSYAFQNCSALESVVFPEGSTGWYVTTSSSATTGTDVDVTNPSTNANNLTGQYYNYYWKR